MKTLLKSVIAGGLFAATAAAQAGVVTISFDANAAAAEAAFVASLNGPLVVENFDGMYSAANHQYTTTGSSNHQQQWSWENEAASFNTAVGTFTLITAGQTANDNIHNDKLMIESKNTGEFGREVLSTSRNDLWLDANDAKKVEWSFGAPLKGSFNAFGFYIADATDQGATLTLQFQDGSWATTSVVIPAFQSNGNLGYVSVYSTSNIVGGKLVFNNSTGGDGWGIDDITIGSVPEPGALMLMGLGLLGLGAARRRTKTN